jgi:hypothetical protein
MVSTGVLKFGRLALTSAAAAFLALRVAHVATPQAVAAPEVDIKAQSMLQLGEVRKISANRVRVTGTFLDRITGVGIPDAHIKVTIGTTEAPVTTGPGGEFAIELPATDGEIPVGLYFAGSAGVDPTSAETVTDPARSPTTLHINTTPTTTGADLTFDVGPDADARLPLVLTIVRDGNEKALGMTYSGEVYPLTRVAIGGAGTVSIKANFAGDPLRQPATTETGIELRVGSTTTLTVDGSVKNVAIAYEDSMRANGTVRDDDGAPAANAAIGLYAADKRIDQTTTDATGKFAISFEAKLLGQGQFGITARTEASATRDGSVSPPVIVAIAAPQPVPVRYTLMAFAATAIAAVVFFAMRRRKVPPPKPAADDNARPVVDVAGGVTLAKPGFTANLRRAQDTTFSGKIRDAWRARPLAGAVIELQNDAAADDKRSMITDAAGEFAFADLPVGSWRATVQAAGHIGEQVAVTVPHRGELRGVVIDLVPVRERVFHLYRRAAEPLLPKPALWGVWSPRQIVDHVRSKRPSPALAELTDLVEEVYFSPRLVEATILPVATTRVEAAMLERGKPS